jgi:hypothetical protein
VKDWLDTFSAPNGPGKAATEKRQEYLELPTPRARVVESCWVTLRLPNGDDHGSVEAIWWFIDDGMLYLSNEQGDADDSKPYRLETGEQPRAVAARLARQRRERAAISSGSVPGFDRPLRYGASGVV